MPFCVLSLEFSVTFLYKVITMTLIPALEWRYATKAFDPTKKIPDADLGELLEALRLAPSSYGLQPWHFIVVTNPELRQKLSGHAWNQAQITDASHLIVLCARRTLTPEYVEEYLASMAAQRGVSVEALAGFRDMLMNTVSGRTEDGLKEWSARQVYIALGFLLAAAAEKQIDSCPMEGFDAAGFEMELGLKDTPWHPVVLCPVGYRLPDDKHAHTKKVRFPAETVIEWR